MEFSMNDAVMCSDQNDGLNQPPGKPMSVFQKIRRHSITKVVAQTGLAVGVSCLMVSHGFCAVEDIPVINLPDGTAADVTNPAATVKAWVVWIVGIFALLVLARGMFSVGSAAIGKFNEWNTNRGDLGALGVAIGAGFVMLAVLAGLGYMIYGLFPATA
jgi:hypothetical protein